MAHAEGHASGASILVRAVRLVVPWVLLVLVGARLAFQNLSADDAEALRHRAEGQRTDVVADRFVVDRDTGQLTRHRACADDDMLALDDLTALLPRHGDLPEFIFTADEAAATGQQDDNPTRHE